MKAKLIFATLLLGSLALAADPVTLVRTYVLGEKDVYGIKMKMAAQGMGEMNIAFTSTQTVKKVYDNGDADIETQASDMELDMMGQHMKPPAGQAQTIRFTKYGVPVGSTATRAGRGPNMNFMRYAFFTGDGEMTPGKAMVIDKTDPDNPKNTVKGTATLVGTENGISKITTSLDVTTADTGDKPMHIDATTWVGSGGKVSRSEAKITNLSTAAGSPMKIDSVDLTMERKN